MTRKRSFKKLREHLTSDDVDKKIEYLESRMPTNNTAFVFSGDPSNPQGNSFETITDGEENETNITGGAGVNDASALMVVPSGNTDNPYLMNSYIQYNVVM